ncbi:MAG: hypothetical protein QXG46_04080 [Ignisphaera sp.]
MDKRYECIVCGRIFHEGQGVKLSLAGKEVNFHSKSCAIKFLKSLILYLDQKDLETATKLTIKEYEEKVKEIREKTKKKLEKI